ncbi:hypothetical protein [Devosia lacusdianchii]|jgi:hypothetical protein|uniref:hypothetical protein n=1 Tax=Devosia lacusdianchii TaxID=2917991 RepID=UPI001F0639B0|nr:hypothetical protein [Devosia sp. JXJ CY 41]
MSRTILSASVAVLMLSLSPAVFAQEMTLMGTPVPADQVERIQAQCDTLAAETGMGAGTSTDTSSPESDDTEASPSGDAGGGEVDFATLDMATITIEACRDGGFTPAAN